MNRITRRICAIYNSLSLVKQICIGVLLGLVLALLFPQAQDISILGTLFVDALKAVAPLLVFVLVLESLAHRHGNSRSNIKHVIVLFFISMLVSAAIAISACMYFTPTVVLVGTTENVSTPSDMHDVIAGILKGCLQNPVEAIARGNYIAILIWAVIFGLGARKAQDTTLHMVKDLSAILSWVVAGIIRCAPLGVLGLMYSTIAAGGLASLAVYTKLLLVMLSSMFVATFIVNPLIVYFTIHSNPFPLVWTCLKESGVTAFFTRSSVANIPVNLALCEKLKLNPATYSVSIPLGATINMSGSAISIATLALATAATLHIEVSWGEAVLLCIMATISACGSSGVAGGSLLLIPLACSIFGIPDDVAMQVVGIGFIIGVVQDSCETALNSSSDPLLTAAADIAARQKESQSVNT